MSVTGTLARPMMAGIFVYGGIDALRNPEGKAKAADDVAPMIAKALHLPMTDTVALVRINGGIQVAAGTLMALGKARRLSALVLAASLVPTTYAGHRFWEEVDEERRAQQRVQFLKNGAMLGGLILAAGDTGGRPSLPWQARRTARQALRATVAAGAASGDAAQHFLDNSKDVTSVVATGVGRRAKKAQQLAGAAKESDMTKRALKAAKKATDADLKRETRKAAAQLARQARKLQATTNATSKRASERAAKLAQQAARQVHDAHLQERAGAAAAQLQSAAGDAAEWSRDNAAAVAHQVAERARETLAAVS